jgi:hypothetical protein
MDLKEDLLMAHILILPTNITVSRILFIRYAMEIISL